MADCILFLKKNLFKIEKILTIILIFDKIFTKINLLIFFMIDQYNSQLHGIFTYWFYILSRIDFFFGLNKYFIRMIKQDQRSY